MQGPAYYVTPPLRRRGKLQASISASDVARVQEITSARGFRDYVSSLQPVSRPRPSEEDEQIDIEAALNTALPQDEDEDDEFGDLE